MEKEKNHRRTLRSLCSVFDLFSCSFRRAEIAFGLRNVRATRSGITKRVSKEHYYNENSYADVTIGDYSVLLGPDSFGFLIFVEASYTALTFVF